MHRLDVPEPQPQPEGARIGVVTFPGSLDEQDAQRAVRLGVLLVE